MTLDIRPPESSLAPLITAMAVLGAISLFAGLFGLYKFIGFMRAALRAKRQYFIEREARCRRAFKAALTQSHACHLISLESLRALGKLMPHEHARNAGILVTLDNYEVPTEGLYALDSPDPLLSSAA